jgi:hypothetical protein
MLFFVAGFVAGVAVGMIVIGFVAVGAWEHGFEEAFRRRKAWRAELVARRTALAEPRLPLRRAS